MKTFFLTTSKKMNNKKINNILLNNKDELFSKIERFMYKWFGFPFEVDFLTTTHSSYVIWFKELPDDIKPNSIHVKLTIQSEDKAIIQFWNNQIVFHQEPLTSFIGI